MTRHPRFGKDGGYCSAPVANLGEENDHSNFLLIDAFGHMLTGALSTMKGWSAW